MLDDLKRASRVMKVGIAVTEDDAREFDRLAKKAGCSRSSIAWMAARRGLPALEREIDQDRAAAADGRTAD